jgi:putative flippase GtrA
VKASKRIFKFGIVGILSTAVHLASLLFFARLVGLPTASANLLAFGLAFLFSTTAQQRFTFVDRLQGQLLKKRSLIILFLVNALTAYGLGSWVKGQMIVFLAFVPPILNYTLLHFFSGHPRFKR